MDFTLHPSLQHFRIVSLAVELWTSHDVRNSLIQFITMKNDTKKETFSDDYKPNCFETLALESKIMDLISAKVEELWLPRILKDGVRKVLKPIGNEIYVGYVGIFKEKVQPYFDYFFNHLQWTPWGQVDRQKTVESLLENHNFDIELRYFWSCTYMCGYYNSKYWYECKEEMKEHLMSRVELSGNNSFQFVDSWGRRREQLEELRILGVKVPNSYPRECITEMVIGGKYEMTFQQFWLSSCQQKKFDIVDKCAKKMFHYPNSICCSEVLFFLMTRMTTEQQNKFFENNVSYIGSLILLDWPRREMLLPIVKEMWNYFDCGHLTRLLFRVADLGRHGFRDVDESRKLLYNIWAQDTNIVEEILFMWCRVFVRVFVISMDAKSVNFLFKNAYATEHLLIFNDVARAISTFPFYTTDENFNLLDEFLRETEFNENEIRTLKTAFIDLECYEIFTRLILEGKLGSVDRILNWALSSEDQIVEYKEYLVSRRIGVMICHEWLVKNDLAAIDQLTNWGFTSNKAKTKFKDTVFSNEIKTLLSKNNVYFTEHFLQYFCSIFTNFCN